MAVVSMRNKKIRVVKKMFAVQARDQNSSLHSTAIHVIFAQYVSPSVYSIPVG